jgi:hypothetical protein
VCLFAVASLRGEKTFLDRMLGDGQDDVIRRPVVGGPSPVPFSFLLSPFSLLLSPKARGRSEAAPSSEISGKLAVKKLGVGGSDVRVIPLVIQANPPRALIPTLARAEGWMLFALLLLFVCCRKGSTRVFCCWCCRRFGCSRAVDIVRWRW